MTSAKAGLPFGLNKHSRHAIWCGPFGLQSGYNALRKPAGVQGGVPKLTPKNPQQLVLASASPRRLDLLGQIHIVPDQILHADSDETPHHHERPNDYALRMACEKALLVAKRLAGARAGALILAGDTVVAAGRRILPKAETEQQARDCLSTLSGRRHRVYGGIALCLTDGSLRHRLVTSHVRFRRLSALDIDHYIEMGDWQGKAGGYAIQGLAARFIRAIDGSYSNIVGFSLYDVAAMLDAAGWRGLGQLHSQTPPRA
jgi:septum formation protein